jgi:hypothetical protein
MPTMMHTPLTTKLQRAPPPSLSQSHRAKSMSSRITGTIPAMNVPSTPVPALAAAASTSPPTTTIMKPKLKKVKSLGAYDLSSISSGTRKGRDNSNEDEALEEKKTQDTSTLTPPTKQELKDKLKKPESNTNKKEAPSNNKTTSKMEAALSSALLTMTPKREKEPKSQENVNASPPRSVKMPWAKKGGHRKTRSLEYDDMAAAAAGAVRKPLKAAGDNRASLPSTPVLESRRSSFSMYPTMIQDLLELKTIISPLQIPSLAKPSPTSFLIGREDEVVRTCELEPAQFQLEIPTLPEFVAAARLNEFLENYRRVDQNFDLQLWVGKNQMDLRQVRIPQHQPIVQSLMECGDDVVLQGISTKGGTADDRVEVAIFEGQRHFTAVFRGTTEQQSKPGAALKSKKNAKNAAVPLDGEHDTVEVYGCFKDEYAKLEKECFAMLDKLTEENPFCDVVFTGHSFGAAMATLAAYKYANARPMMRVSCLTLASPKVGFEPFKQLVNSSPNLKIMRLEYGQDGKCHPLGLVGAHVGHTLVLHGSLGQNSLKTSQPVLAYKFDTPKYKKFKTAHPDLRTYVNALEEMARIGLPWATDFVGTSGQGVVGVNNEARQMV